MRDAGWWVDQTAHRLHHGEHTFACSRDIEAMAVWKEHALLLSSDTDCLSIWDVSGIVRTVRVGVYPQDMAVCRDVVIVCGGADGRLHELSLPDLRLLSTTSLPGMPERIALHGTTAFVLTLLPEYDVHTSLLAIDMTTGQRRELSRYRGIPGALHASHDGLWVAVSEQLLYLPHTAGTAPLTISGFGLIRRLRAVGGGVIAIDPLEERTAWLTSAPSLVPLPRDDADFTTLIP